MSELANNFGIDWKLLLAQAVNFFLLFVLLKKFAYGPVIALLRERRQKIEEGLRMRAEAAQNFEDSNRMRTTAEHEAQQRSLQIITEAGDKAKMRGEEILAETYKKNEQAVAEARRIIQQERDKMADGVYTEAEMLIRETVAKVLGRMPAEERDRELIREALRELKTERL